MEDKELSINDIRELLSTNVVVNKLIDIIQKMDCSQKEAKESFDNLIQRIESLSNDISAVSDKVNLIYDNYEKVIKDNKTIHAENKRLKIKLGEGNEIQKEEKSSKQEKTNSLNKSIKEKVEDVIKLSARKKFQYIVKNNLTAELQKDYQSIIEYMKNHNLIDDNLKLKK